MLTYLSKQIRENENQSAASKTLRFKSEQLCKLTVKLNYFTDKYCALKLSAYRNEGRLTDKQKLVVQKKLSKLKMALFRAEAKISEHEGQLAYIRETELILTNSNLSNSNKAVDESNADSTLDHTETNSNADYSEPKKLADLEFSGKIQAILHRCTTEILSTKR